MANATDWLFSPFDIASAQEVPFPQSAVATVLVSWTYLYVPFPFFTKVEVLIHGST